MVLLLLLSVPLGAQETVQPVRVAIAPPHDNALNRELHSAVTAELRKLKYVILTTRRADYDIGVVAASLAAGKTGCAGLVASMVVVDMDKPDERKISLYMGPDAKQLARDLVTKLNKEVFKR